jgi:hypothetical protein
MRVLAFAVLLAMASSLPVSTSAEDCECYNPVLTFAVPAATTIHCWDVFEYTGTASACSLPPTSGCNADGDCLGFLKCSSCDEEVGCLGTFKAIGYVGDWSGHEGERWTVCHVTSSSAPGWKCVTLRPCD